MSLMHSEYQARVAHWQRVLAQDFYHPLEKIQFEGFTTMEHLTPEQAQAGAFAPFAEGTPWGHTWEYLWLRASITPSPPGTGEAHRALPGYGRGSHPVCQR